MTRLKKKIAIVDYGVGNLRSLTRAFEAHGANVTITEEIKEVEGSDALVLPGDGAFGAGMRGLAKRGLTKSIIEVAEAGKPILGICLGAQILMSEGYEFGRYTGLGLIAGKVVKFPKFKYAEKIPQIGWNMIYSKNSKAWKGTILDSIKINSNVYFIHSYILVPKITNNILAVSRYGGIEFCSVVASGRIYGCQFHPEKSGTAGLAIIKNFVEYVENV